MVFLPGEAQAEEGCKAAVERFNSAREASNVEQMVDAYSELTQSATACSETVTYCAGNAVALGFLEAGYAAYDRGAKASEIRSLVEKGRTFGSPWQLLTGLADIRFGEARASKNGGDFQAAARLYQDALNVIGEPAICPSSMPPEPQEISAIHKRMTEALLLAPQFELVRTRAGGCGGIFLASIRGFTPTFRPLPIGFEFGKAEFTPAGAKAASVLLECLLEKSPKKVVLSGHTDPIGSDDYNYDLSRRRLDAVASYLKAGGFGGELALLPKGAREPFVPDDPSAYSDDELNQLDRRVALRETIE
jgi:outer membrane protein OmpA-like peptidoglycan-associated protein